MNQRIEFYMAAFVRQGKSFDIPIVVGTSRYQYGQELGDVLHGILKFILKFAVLFKPVVMTTV